MPFEKLKLYVYRPQRSCGKVMFLHVSVILFTGGGRQTPLAGRHPLPPPLGRHPPAGRHNLPGTPTPVDGTHPTGMHSCFNFSLVQWLKYSRKEYCELCKHKFVFKPSKCLT